MAGPDRGRGTGPRAILPPGGARPRIMGVINATPDSFWRGSRHPDPQDAAATAVAMVAAGAHMLDVGAVSTRPGAGPVSVETELERLLPVLVAVRRAVDCPISVDTTRSRVAAAAIASGADAINDVSGLDDPDLGGVVAHTGAALIVMAHDPIDAAVAGPPEVCRQLQALVVRAERAGMARDCLVLDPGFGFGKSPTQNLQLVAALPYLRARLGVPLCIGPSRKGTIAAVLGRRPVGRRQSGTAALVALCAAYGADLVRVHDVGQMAEVAALAAAVGPPDSSPPSVPARPGWDRPADSTDSHTHGEGGLISLRGLRIEACHGVLPQEHEQPQPFLLDLDLECDLGTAARTDQLEATLNYASAAALAAAVVRGPHRDLIESLAGEIARRLLAEFPLLRGGAVVVHKPRAPVGLPFGDVSVRFPFARRDAVTDRAEGGSPCGCT